MHGKPAKILFFATCILSSFSLIFLSIFPEASAASSFGTDYRHLTTVSPGATPDTTTTISVGSGVTGTFIVNPFTSGSTSTGTPSTSSLSGFGWRTAGVVGASIPAGTWSFTVTTQAGLTSALANGRVKVFAYSTDTLGSGLSSIGSATGTTNVFSLLTAQTETITLSASAVDLTNKVLVVEYWIDVTTGPLLATTLTFQAASSTQTVVLPSSSGTYYLGKASLFSIGESESGIVSDALSRTIALARTVVDSAITTDSSPSRAIISSRTIAEASGATVTDSVTKFTGFMRQISETGGIDITDSVTKSTGFFRQVSEPLGAVMSDGVSRVSIYLRETLEASGSIPSDSISRLLNSSRQNSEGSMITESVIGTGGYFRAISEAGGAGITDSVAKSAGFIRDISESSGAVASDSVSKFTSFARQVAEATGAVSVDSISRAAAHSRNASEASDALVVDGVSRIAEYARFASETSDAILSDSVSKIYGYTRLVVESSGAIVTEGISRDAILARGISETSSIISDLVSRILNAINPPSSGGGGGGGGGGGDGFIIDEPSTNEPPPVQNGTEIRNRHLNVRVSDRLALDADNIVDVEENQLNATHPPDRLNLMMFAKLDSISTSPIPILPSARGSFTIDIVNQASTTEEITFSYWLVDNSTGERIQEGVEAISLLPNQTFSKSLQIPFHSPGVYSLEGTASRSDGDAITMNSLQVPISWISIYLFLLLICIAATLLAIDIWVSVRRKRNKKRREDGWRV